ncbi:MAG: SpoIIE family protein phosphatase [Proteobacteria bacterium]|nr:SpoIIE family protein phosphatase [Pseudomonadota bacterium]
MNIPTILEKAKNISKQTWLFLALLAVTLLLAITQLGILSNSTFSITLFLVPIALGASLLGLWQGLLFALIFGLCSIWMASELPINDAEHVFVSPWVSIVPRLAAAFLSWAIAAILKRTIDDTTHSAKMLIGNISAIILALMNNIFVMLVLARFYPHVFGIDGEVDTFLKQSAIITDIISGNLIYELIITTSVVTLVTWLYYRKEEIKTAEISMGKNIRKWICLITLIMGFSMFAGSFAIDTIFEDNCAEETIELALRDIQKDYALLSKRISNRELLYKIGQHGHTLILRNNELIASDMTLPESLTYADLGLEHLNYDHTFGANLYEKKWLCRAIPLEEGMTLMGMIPKYEIHVARNRTLIELIIGFGIIITIIYWLLNYIIRKNVTNNVQKVRNGLQQIRTGQLETRLAVHTNREFYQISEDINDTVQSLQDAKDEVKQHIQAELDLARHIQLSMLPPGSQIMPRFKLSASYIPAREVGGDFYDYFKLPGERIGLVIADVSGKGIPAAMFMMTAKTIIKDISQRFNSPAEVLTLANQILCENNDAEMFVTLWLGFVDLENGMLTFANAGHNPPIWVHGNDIEYLDYKHYKRGLMLGAMDCSKYYDNSINLSFQNQLILYTDGITEASNHALELFGDTRLIDTIKAHPSEDSKQIEQSILQSVKTFEEGAEQADDKTLLVFCMNMNIQSVQVTADASHTQQISDFVETTLSNNNISGKMTHKFLICTDEIFSNIVQYSKATRAEVVIRQFEGQISIEFIDDGTAYNPLDASDPDTTLSLEDRGVGGYGIYIVKKMMSDVSYQYIDHHNHLKISLSLS